MIIFHPLLSSLSISLSLSLSLSYNLCVPLFSLFLFFLSVSPFLFLFLCVYVCACVYLFLSLFLSLSLVSLCLLSTSFSSSIVLSVSSLSVSLFLCLCVFLSLFLSFYLSLFVSLCVFYLSLTLYFSSFLGSPDCLFLCLSLNSLSSLSLFYVKKERPWRTHFQNQNFTLHDWILYLKSIFPRPENCSSYIRILSSRYVPYEIVMYGCPIELDPCYVLIVKWAKTPRTNSTSIVRIWSNHVFRIVYTHEHFSCFMITLCAHKNEHNSGLWALKYELLQFLTRGVGGS